ncbi:MAG: tRNA (cytidine(34)-2'-O)-methyltransferase [Phycisphaerae bacterium]|nr:tRNA (cytidine(34)-2'-O)-methyltransferase [Phycisphaerae bacterium]MBT5657772.1 tRNA (cytidine(34)-2'-O)-methyltransferase [Phycisphaerae bacterium]
MPVHIVLLNPEIPNNTGTIGRTAAATGAVLHVVHPITFDMSEKARRRAGLDYWDQIDCREHENWQAFLDAEQPERLWAMTARADRPVWEASIQKGDYLLFGCETRGLSEAIQAWAISRWGPACRLSLPVRPPARSLNLACAVTAAVYEAVRQVSVRG